MNIGKKLKRVLVEPLELPKQVQKGPAREPKPLKKEEPVTVDK